MGQRMVQAGAAVVGEPARQGTGSQCRVTPRVDERRRVLSQERTSSSCQ